MRKTKHYVLGEGYLWFLGRDYNSIALAKKRGCTCSDPIQFKHVGRIGAWRKFKLVAIPVKEKRK